MPANFTKGQRELLYAKLIETGYTLIQEVGLKKMSIALITKRVNIATGTFYHFFDSKEAFVQALIDYQDQQLLMELKDLVERQGKFTLKQAVSSFREAFKMENNFLMRLTLEDWVWLKTHLASHGLFNENHDLKEVQTILPYIKDLRPDLDFRVVINFFKTIYSMAQNRETFIKEVFETNVDLIFECIYHYAYLPKKEGMNDEKNND